MKKLIHLALLFCTSSYLFGEMAYDQKTNKFYSKNAPKNVNQEEYNKFAREFFTGLSYINTIPEWQKKVVFDKYTASCFVDLRLIGSPASMRLISDIKELIKYFRDEFDAIQNL